MQTTDPAVPAHLWARKNDRACQFEAEAQAALMPHADACHHLTFGFYTEAAAAKIQQGGAQGHA